ncbi:MAG: class I SAM-dependent methyltransferase [Pseudolabrys sp.]|nr:class I SAM-dependent methyltransferase [Pseudolabrys sp.]
MRNEIGSRVRYGEAFWRAHQEAWQQSGMNQREYCDAQGIPLKAFGNWRARFKAEPQLPVRKLLYRRAGLSHRLSHSLSHHHVPPAQWADFVCEMRRVVRPGGKVIVYEHNPFNPATQWIVNTCLIDADAVLLRSGVLKRLMRQVELGSVAREFIIFTPIDRPLFRRIDRALWWLPFGAQYAISGTR